MFCKKCGTEIKDGLRFCPKCGDEVLAATQNANGDIKYVNVNTKKNSIIGMAAAGLIVLVVASLILWAVFGGRSYKTVIGNVVEDIFSMNEESIEDLLALFPDEMIEKEVKKEKVESEKELVEKLVKKFKTQRELYAEQLEDVKYKITDDEDFSEEKLKKLVEDFEDADIVLQKKIKAAKKVTVEITVNTKDGDENTTDLSFDVIKMGRNWYLAQSDVLKYKN